MNASIFADINVNAMSSNLVDKLGKLKPPSFKTPYKTSTPSHPPRPRLNDSPQCSASSISSIPQIPSSSESFETKEASKDDPIVESQQQQSSMKRRSEDDMEAEVVDSKCSKVAEEPDDVIMIGSSPGSEENVVENTSEVVKPDSPESRPSLSSLKVSPAEEEDVEQASEESNVEAEEDRMIHDENQVAVLRKMLKEMFEKKSESDDSTTGLGDSFDDSGAENTSNPCPDAEDNVDDDDDGRSFFDLDLDDIQSEFDEEEMLKFRMNSTLARADQPQLSTLSGSSKSGAGGTESVDQFTSKEYLTDSSMLDPHQNLQSYQSSSAGLALSSVTMDNLRSNLNSSISRTSVSAFRSNTQSSSSFSSTGPAARSRMVEDDNEDRSEVLLSFFYSGVNLGAAVYQTDSCMLHLLKDIPDNMEENEVLEMLLFQCEPDLVLMSARQDQKIINFVQKVMEENRPVDSDQDQLHSTSTSSTTTSKNNSNILLRPSNEFSHGSCERRMKLINVPGDPQSSLERSQLISAHIDFDCVAMIRAAGALMKYVDKNYRLEDDPDVLFISTLSLDSILGVDIVTLTSLQVFNRHSQLSGSTAGSWNKKREGLSLFNSLNRCSSVVGTR